MQGSPFFRDIHDLSGNHVLEPFLYPAGPGKVDKNLQGPAVQSLRVKS